MMESLPIDMDHPVVREYLHLVRLQVLTPLSLLINIATVMICTIVIKPGIGEVLKLYPTPLTPSATVIIIYSTLCAVGQIGYCFLLVFARKRETKQTFLKGVGMALVFANWVIAFWAIAWVTQSFIVATMFAALLLLLLLYSNTVLLIYHHPHSRPLDTAFIHMPLKLFFILALSVLLPDSLFVALGWSYSPGEPQHYARHQWPAFGIVLGINLLGLLIIASRRDLTWCVAATFIAVSIWVERPKPFAVYITALVFTFLHPVVLVASTLYSHLRSKKRQPIQLPTDESEGQPENEGGNREVDASDIWG